MKKSMRSCLSVAILTGCITCHLPVLAQQITEHSVAPANELVGTIVSTKGMRIEVALNNGQKIWVSTTMANPENLIGYQVSGTLQQRGDAVVLVSATYDKQG
ncbi:hypothetical protein [Paraglaciecola sp.]|uniref:hypothetical protein n=1 Tax=Paraglaciecola sp. TaxID=1920173 RepID=UPI0030F4AE46